MKVKFNPTGTHVHRGFLKVRIDLYPAPSDKTYLIHHIQVPIIPPEGYQGALDGEGSPVDWDDYNDWIDGLPKVWQLNPALCHFITIDPNTTLASLREIVRGVFNKVTVDQLDDLLSKFDTPKVTEAMRSKVGKGRKLPIGVDTIKLRDRLNSRFAGLEIEV